MVEQLNQHTQRLREAGYKLTNARLTVLRVIEESNGHITSAEVLTRVHATDAGIGRASVFRTLDLLTQLGIIRPVYIDSSVTPAYVLLPEGHHHHFVCTHCHRTIEIEYCGLQEVEAKIACQLNVQLTGHLVEFYGLCADCTETTQQ
jgi:Fe2+ or Zn2+ uptake regulation protein